MPTDRDVVYVYGIVSDAFDAHSAPAGLDDAPVRITTASGSGFAALTSPVSSSEYAPGEIEQRGGDVAWLSPRAQAHDRVLTWAQERDIVIPLPIFSLWANTDSLTQSLSSQRDRLSALMQRVSGCDEFGLRVYRRDSVLLTSIESIDPDAADLRAQATAASPGQRYLLERKLAEHAKAAVKTAGQRIAREVFEKLRVLARESMARPVTPDSTRVDDATMILNGAFLVERTRYNAFREAVGALVGEYGPTGLAFDFTGPWPPYNFVADGGAPALSERA